MTKWKYNDRWGEWHRKFGPLTGVARQEKNPKDLCSWFVVKQHGDIIPLACGITNNIQAAKIASHKAVKKIITKMCMDAKFIFLQ